MAIFLFSVSVSVSVVVVVVVSVASSVTASASACPARLVQFSGPGSPPLFFSVTDLSRGNASET